MSKKLIRKGLAITATVALGFTGFAALPANANGLADKSFVSLLPQKGTEYNVLSNQYFDLKSNAASGIASTGNLKFLVADTTSKTKFDVDVNAASGDAVQANSISNVGISSAAGAMTLSVAATAVITRTAHGLSVGDTIVISGVTGTNEALINGTFLVATAPDGNTFTTNPAIDNDPALTFDATAAVIKRISSRNVAGTIHTLHSTGHSLVVGDSITLAGFSGAGLSATYTVTSRDANSFSFTTTALTAVVDSDNTNTVTRNSSTVLESRDRILEFTSTFGHVSLIGSTPSKQANVAGGFQSANSDGRVSTANGSYVVNSGVNSSTDDKVLRLVNTDAAAGLTVEVTAWVDANSNGLIDPTEYTSPTRTVTFALASAVTATATLTTPVNGDANLTATIATVPVLNGNQVEDQDSDATTVGAFFTRQDSTSTGVAATEANVSWNDTTKLWTATVPLAVTGANTRNAAATLWTGLFATGQTSQSREGTSAIASNVATIVTGNAHNLRVGDRVTFAGSTPSTVNGQKTITAVPSATSFRFAVTNADAAISAGTYSVTTFASGNDAIIDRVFPGAYSAQAAIGSTKLGAVASNLTAVAIAADGKTASPSSPNTRVTITENASAASDGNAAIAVRYATTAVSATFSFTDANGAALPAGRSVVLTVGIADATGVTVNGTARADGALISAVTNASGQVVAAVTTTSGNASDVITLTAVAEGQSTSSTSATFTWTATAYVLHDLNSNSASDHRNVAVGGTYAFNFAMLDNWGVVPATGSYRLNVVLTNRTVSTTNVAMTNGRATVSVTDAALITGSQVNVSVTPQLANSAGTFQDSATATGGTSVVAPAVPFVVNPSGQTGRVTAVVAGSPVALNTNTLVAGDERTSQLDVTEPIGATLSGVVSDSVTGALRPGAEVTITGSPSMLFISDLGSSMEFASLGSIKVHADSSGAYSVHITSNTSQVATPVTVSALGATDATPRVTIARAADDTATAVRVSAPKSIKSGRTLIYTMTLVDKFGNPVVTNSAATGFVNGTTDPTFSLTYTGPGLVVQAIPTSTDANGQIRLAILAGSSDTGIASFTVAYDSNGAVANVPGTTLAWTSSTAVWVGPIANAKAGAKAGRVIVEAYRAKGKTVSVFVGATRVATFTADKANFRAVVRGINSGTRNVSVRLSGPGEDFRGAITVK